MNFQNIAKNIIYIFSIIGIILLMLFYNSVFRDMALYGGPVFHVQLRPSLIFLTMIFFVVIFLFAEKIYKKFYFCLENYSTKNKFLLIALISFIFKLVLYNFNLESDDVTPELDSIFVEGHFNQYKLYSFLALFISKITVNYNFYLTLINILLGSFSISILYLIFSTFSKNNTKHFLALIFIILFVPLNVIETMIRVDTLFLFLFLLSIYFLIRQMNNNNFKNILLLNFVLFLSCICRESTIYLLPLFIFISFFANKNKFISILTITVTVFITTSVLLSYNEKTYGIKSRIKEYHLIYNMMHYGYLNEENILGYKKKLSPEANSLLQDIKISYERNVPPHKRKDFDQSRLGVMNNVKLESYLERHLTAKTLILLDTYWYLIRPDFENIAIKSTITPYIGDLKKVKYIYTESIKKAPQIISVNELDKILTDSSLKLTENNNKDLAKYFKSQLFYSFLFRDGELDGSSEGDCKKILRKNRNNKESSTIFFERACILKVINNFSHDFMTNRSDNWLYKKAAIPFVWHFNKNTKLYEQHPNISYVEEIIMSIPTLYITQSILTLFGMSGHVSVPSGIGLRANIYEENILPKIFLIEFQGLYAVIMNFWYVFSFFVLVSSIFIEKDRDTRIREFIIGVIPIYYGLFLVFAVHFEFARLMIPIAPFIIYNFLVTISIILEVLKDTYVLFWNSTKKK